MLPSYAVMASVHLSQSYRSVALSPTLKIKKAVAFRFRRAAPRDEGQVQTGFVAVVAKVYYDMI